MACIDDPEVQASLPHGHETSAGGKMPRLLVGPALVVAPGWTGAMVLTVGDAVVAVVAASDAVGEVPAAAGA